MILFHILIISIFYYLFEIPLFHINYLTRLELEKKLNQTGTEIKILKDMITSIKTIVRVKD
jgi:hypothetical protein